MLVLNTLFSKAKALRSAPGRLGFKCDGNVGFSKEKAQRRKNKNVCVVQEKSNNFIRNGFCNN